MGNGMGAERLKSTTDEMQTTLAEAVRGFADEHPECKNPTHAPLYAVTLSLAISVDRSPSAALYREYGLANGRLRKEVLGNEEDDGGLLGLMGDDDD